MMMYMVYHVDMMLWNIFITTTSNPGASGTQTHQERRHKHCDSRTGRVHRRPTGVNLTRAFRLGPGGSSVNRKASQAEDQGDRGKKEKPRPG